MVTRNAIRNGPNIYNQAHLLSKGRYCAETVQTVDCLYT
jgi:hypothetical protein